jgi:transcriptional regulator with XRE-family HTH domain
MERNLPADCQLDWPEIVVQAKRRRRQIKLTQRRLAVVAGVSLPTVVKFEAGEDVRLSSALAILKVLEMTVTMLEGTLRIRYGGGQGTEPFHVMFSPYAGAGGSTETKSLPDLAALEDFLDSIRVGTDEKQKALAEVVRINVASILRVQISSTEARRYWPEQFAIPPK